MLRLEKRSILLKYKSAESKIIVQQGWKSPIFGTVENFLIFGTVVHRYCWVPPLVYVINEHNKTNKTTSVRKNQDVPSAP